MTGGYPSAPRRLLNWALPNPVPIFGSPQRLTVSISRGRRSSVSQWHTSARLMSGARGPIAAEKASQNVG